VPFAHRFGAKVFVTLNTILHDDELEPAQRLITDLYEAGVDALIVQDMGVWSWIFRRLSCTPVPSAISAAVRKRSFSPTSASADRAGARAEPESDPRFTPGTDATIEFFIHGALCVAYSGQCNISHAQTGRSANRGDCSQACRLPYTLKDDQGRVVA
jgi:putative protease